MANTTPGTPLTRYGSRMPSISPQRVTPSTKSHARPALTPTATIRTMIVCLPDELPRASLTAHQLDRHFGVTGTLAPRFWASAALHRWQRGQMFALRKGRPAYCAGGPVRLLDLAGMRHAASIGAGIRHQLWAAVVEGTRPATPWATFEARHLADPHKYSLEAAAADFNNQPRVNAMRMHNAVNHGPGQLAVGELEVFQAGQMAYQHYRAAIAVAADALLTADGAKLAPASDTMAHRVTYLEQAGRYLDTVEDSRRLLAVAL